MAGLSRFVSSIVSGDIMIWGNASQTPQKFKIEQQDDRYQELHWISGGCLKSHSIRSLRHQDNCVLMHYHIPRQDSRLQGPGWYPQSRKWIGMKAINEIVLNINPLINTNPLTRWLHINYISNDSRKKLTFLINDSHES